MVIDQGYYRKGFDKLVSNSHSWRNVANAIPFVVPYLKKTDRLLDVGLGPGTISKDLANYVDSVVGVEPTRDLVDLASNQEDLPELVTFQLALAYDLPFDDEAFDVVLAHQVIVHLEDPVSALKEMKRVCKKGGVILVKDVDMSMNAVYPKVYEDVIRIRNDAKYSKSSTSMTAGRQLKERALLAGFVSHRIKMDGLVWFVSDYEDRKKWCDIWVSRILAGKEVDYDSNKEDLDQVIKAYGDWRDDERSVMILVHAELIYQKE